jgi:hypothetical protein
MSPERFVKGEPERTNLRILNRRVVVRILVLLRV